MRCRDLYNESAVSDVILAPYKQRDLPLDFFVFDFFCALHTDFFDEAVTDMRPNCSGKRPRTGWGGYSWDASHFPDWQAMLAGFRSGNNSYGSPLKTTNNIHPSALPTLCSAPVSFQSRERSCGPVL